MRLGIIQGRLSEPKLGHQTTPSNWMREFNLLEKLNLSHIEWNVDSARSDKNPIFSLTDAIVIDKISSVCFDNAVTEKIFQDEFFHSTFLEKIVILEKLGISSFTLPLLEGAHINTEKRVAKIKLLILNALSACPGAKICVESDSELTNILDVINVSDRVFFTYDTGNLTASNRDHQLYISSLFHKIENIHLKDRKASGGESVLENGDTDFNMIFSLLSSLNYSGIFTLQMARGKTGQEPENILLLSQKFRRMYEEYF